jgi:two-component system sensor histidine kinase PilS (NtrC family)
MDESPLRRSLFWLTTIRIVVFVLILLSAILVQVGSEAEVEISYLYGLCAAALVLSAFHWTAGRFLPARAEAYVQILGDLALVCLLVYSSGGPNSVFTFLYLVVIGAAAFLLFRTGAVIIASAAALAHGLMVELTAYEVLPRPRMAAAAPWGGAERIGYNLAITVVGFYGVAFMVSYLSEKLRGTREELENRQRALSRIQTLYANVLASMSSGLVTADARQRVTFLNQAGGDILGIVPARRSGSTADIGWTCRGLGADPRRTRGARATVPRSRSRARFPARARLLGARAQGPGRRGRALIVSRTSRRSSGSSGRRGSTSSSRPSESWRPGSRTRSETPRVDLGIGRCCPTSFRSGRPSAGSWRSSCRSPIGSQDPRGVPPVRAAAGRRVASFDVAGSIKEVLALFRLSDEVSDAHRIVDDVRPETSPLSGDRDQIRQIVYNVAKNAVRAMPDGGTLTVEGREDDAWYSIKFRDTGRGMSQEEIARVFTPFSTAFDGGTGLGMAIVRRIVEDHGGAIDVESAPGAGTTVTILLPRSAAAHVAAGRAAAGSEAVQ